MRSQCDIDVTSGEHLLLETRILGASVVFRKTTRSGELLEWNGQQLESRCYPARSLRVDLIRGEWAY